MRLEIVVMGDSLEELEKALCVKAEEIFERKFSFGPTVTQTEESLLEKWGDTHCLYGNDAEVNSAIQWIKKYRVSNEGIGLKEAKDTWDSLPQAFKDFINKKRNV